MAATPTRILSILLLLFAPILANVEKTIFLGPELTKTRASLSSLPLHTLTPDNSALRTQLAARFPASSHPLGTATWLVLDKLTPDRRYEVRVCWPATPTAFSLETFSLSTVQTTPELLASLHNSSSPHSPPSLTQPQDEDAASSILLLRILAAADYFTADASLMRTVPPVDVHIILDPFLFNVLPRSLAGTACYIVAVAITAYFLARRIASGIQKLIAAGNGQVEGGIKKKQ